MEALSFATSDYDNRISHITYDEAWQHLQCCDSYSYLPALLDIQYQMNEADFLRLLGEEWSGFDSIGHYIDDLLDSPLCWTFEPDVSVRPEMMTQQELAAYGALPDIVTVYRGCYEPNKWGLSWSLSRATAEQFPTLNRYRQPGQALLVTAQAKKDDIIAVKLDRGESEIITWHPKHRSTRYICPTPTLKAAIV